MVGEKVSISSHSPHGSTRKDSILVITGPTSEILMVQASSSRSVVMTRKEVLWAQICGSSLDKSVPGDDVTPETTSYTRTT